MYRFSYITKTPPKIPASENPYTLGYTSTSKLKIAGFLTAIDSLPVITTTPYVAYNYHR
jgi:hypothetical protein